MLKRKNDDYQKVCFYCENASILKGEENLLCKHKGIVSQDFVCRKFVYDPLKREPKPTLKMPKIDKDSLL